MTAKMVSKPHRKDSRPDWDDVRVKDTMPHDIPLLKSINEESVTEPMPSIEASQDLRVTPKQAQLF